MSLYRQKAKDIHRLIHDILLNEWDPIGVSGIPEATNEYDSYVPQIHGLIIRKEPVEKFFDFLWWVETSHMELCGNRKRTQLIAEKLFKIAQDKEIL